MAAPAILPTTPPITTDVGVGLVSASLVDSEVLEGCESAATFVPAPARPFTTSVVEDMYDDELGE